MRRGTEMQPYSVSNSEGFQNLDLGTREGYLKDSSPFLNINHLHPQFS